MTNKEAIKLVLSAAEANANGNLDGDRIREAIERVRLLVGMVKQQPTVPAFAREFKGMGTVKVEV
jgi:hypothetical protein